MGPQEHKVERRLAAIFAADVAGYSRLMSQDEVGTLRTLTAHREIMDRLIAEYGGRIANTAGRQCSGRVPQRRGCGSDALSRFRRHSLPWIRTGPEERHLQFRIGIHVGDVMVSGGDLLGDGVNIAARLEGLAEPGGICISAATHAYVRRTLPIGFDDLGPLEVKNIDEPVHAYRVRASALPPPDAAQGMEKAKPLPLPDKPSIAVLPFTNMSGDPEQDHIADGHRRGDNSRIIPLSVIFRHLAQFIVQLQAQSFRCAPSEPRTRSAVCCRGERQKIREPPSDYGAVD